MSPETAPSLEHQQFCDEVLRKGEKLCEAVAEALQQAIAVEAARLIPLIDHLIESSRREAMEKLYEHQRRA